MASWATISTKLSTARRNHAALAINDTQIIIIGGRERGYRTLASVELFDSDSDSDSASSTTTRMSPLSVPRYGFSASILNDYVYVCGGTGFGVTNLDFVERLPILRLTADTQWESEVESESIQPMNECRCRHMSATVNNKLYVFGGSTGLTVKSSAECYNDITNTWDYIPKMPTPRIDAAVAVVSSKIYLVGGRNNFDSRLSSVDVFDVSSNTWSSGPSLPIGLASPSAVSVQDGFIVLVGGTYFHDNDEQTATSIDSDKSFVLNLTTNEWTEAKRKLTFQCHANEAIYLPKSQYIFNIGGTRKIIPRTHSRYTNVYLTDGSSEAEHDHGAYDSIEKISFWKLIGMQWSCLRLRLLVQYRRAVVRNDVLASESENQQERNGDFPLTQNARNTQYDEDNGLMIIQHFIVHTNDDIFRTVLESFL